MDKFILDAIKRRILTDADKGVTVKIRREPSLTEREAEWRPIGTGVLFCVHKKSYFEVCNSCKRDKSLAEKHFQLFCNKHGISV